MGLAGLQYPGHELLPGEGFARPLAVQFHVLLAEAAAPVQRFMVVQPEIVLHPDDGGIQHGVPGVQPGNVALPFGAQRADTEACCPAVGVHHRAEGLFLAQPLAQVGVHDAVPLVHRKADPAPGQQIPHPGHQGQIQVLFLPAHVAGVQFLHIGEHRHIVHKGFVHKPVQRGQFRLVVEARVAAETENIGKGILHGVSSCWSAGSTGSP